jgi:Fur family zinc uptake transcriptional regulator
MPQAFARHDHRRCITQAVEQAVALCRARNVRLTAQRRRVLELVWAGHKPVGAYELLERLRAEGTNAVPPTVYRALDFLREQGLVHRIESLNAFVGCTHPEQDHGGQFLVCSACGQVAELDDAGIAAAMDVAADRLGFAPERRVVEVSGKCGQCRRHG